MSFCVILRHMSHDIDLIVVYNMIAKIRLNLKQAGEVIIPANLANLFAFGVEEGGWLGIRENFLLVKFYDGLRNFWPLVLF